MKETDKILESAGSAWEYGKQYLENQRDLLKLEAAEQAARMISAMATTFVVGFFFALMLVFASIALALWISAIYGSAMLGFGVVSGIYLVVGLIVFLFRRTLVANPVLSAVIKNIFA